jgi:mannose-1-phosphate guanylyltransferase
MMAVIMAGGSGTRLWPRSRQGRPKQFIDLLGEHTMLQQTLERLVPMMAWHDIYIVTSREYGALVEQQASHVPPQNILFEPYGRNTAPCIALAAIHLARRGRDEPMAVLPADHYIGKPEEFRRILQAGARIAKRGYLVTLGIVPDRPETGYGYIRRGTKIDVVDGLPVYRVERFTEKPDPDTASQYVASGWYYWNSGMFLWTPDTILREIATHMPELYDQIMRVDTVLGTEREWETLACVWERVQPQSIDYGVMERSRNAVVIPADIGWSDVGDWAALASILPADEMANTVRSDHVGIDTKNTLIYGSGRLIATIGLEGMMVIDAGDAILVCPKDRAQQVKELVEKLKRMGREDLV